MHTITQTIRKSAVRLQFDPLPKNLRSRSNVCLINGLFHVGSSQILRFIGNLMLTRLLFPEALGLMALVNAVIIGFDMISDMGLQPAVIKKKGLLTSDYLNTGWTLQIIRGFALFGITILLAYPVGLFFERPEVYWILPSLGLVRWVTGFRSVSIWLIERDLKPTRHTVLNFISSAIGIGSSILLAIGWKHVGALVVGNLIWAISNTLGSFLIRSGHQHRLMFDREALSDFLKFGKWIIISSGLVFLGLQGDKLLLAKVLDAHTLGLYTLALFLIQAFTGMVSAVSTKVLLPLYSREGADDQNRNMFHMMLWGTMPFIFMLILGGDRIIDSLYDYRYHRSGEMLEYLALAIPPMILRFLLSPMFLAKGDSFRKMLLSVFEAVLVIAFMLFGYMKAGIYGFIFGYSIAQYLLYFVTRILLWKHQPFIYRGEWIFLVIGNLVGSHEWMWLTKLVF